MNTEQISKYRYPFYILKHPIDGYEELRFNKKGSMLIANIILFLWFLLGVINDQNTGFIFNNIRPEDYNIIFKAVSTIGIFMLWVISNWSLCTLTDGEGKFKDIYITSAYALIPFVISYLPILFLNNVLTAEEGIFINYMALLVKIYSVVLIINAIKSVHQFTLKKTIATIILTVFGILIIIFLGFLLFTLFQQVIDFIISIVNELLFRM